MIEGSSQYEQIEGMSEKLTLLVNKSISELSMTIIPVTTVCNIRVIIV